MNECCRYTVKSKVLYSVRLRSSDLPTVVLKEEEVDPGWILVGECQQCHMLLRIQFDAHGDLIYDDELVMPKDVFDNAFSVIRHGMINDMQATALRRGTNIFQIFETNKFDINGQIVNPTGYYNKLDPKHRCRNCSLEPTIVDGEQYGIVSSNPNLTTIVSVCRDCGSSASHQITSSGTIVCTESITTTPEAEPVVAEPEDEFTFGDEDDTDMDVGLNTELVGNEDITHSDLELTNEVPSVDDPTTEVEQPSEETDDAFPITESQDTIKPDHVTEMHLPVTPERSFTTSFDEAITKLTERTKMQSYHICISATITDDMGMEISDQKNIRFKANKVVSEYTNKARLLKLLKSTGGDTEVLTAQVKSKIGDGVQLHTRFFINGNLVPRLMMDAIDDSCLIVSVDADCGETYIANVFILDDDHHFTITSNR